MTENERFGLVFANTGSINSGTGVWNLWLWTRDEWAAWLKKCQGIEENFLATFLFLFFFSSLRENCLECDVYRLVRASDFSCMPKSQSSGLIPAFSDTDASEGRQMKPCWIEYWRKSPFLKYILNSDLLVTQQLLTFRSNLLLFCHFWRALHAFCKKDFNKLEVLMRFSTLAIRYKQNLQARA
jgi:hypothetical protein